VLLREVSEQKIEPCRDRIDEIRAHRERRDASRVREALAALRDCAADGDRDLTPGVIEGFAAGATVGEMAGMLRMAYGQPYDPLGMAEAPI
jgi:methylmalonyl-CoA mutase N-terminal domain/subunit